MARVSVNSLSKTFPAARGEVHAVRDLSFEVKDKELLVLAGPSGCGKTTTLRLISGLEHATAGSISIDGRVVNDVPAKDREVAMVFQNLALYPHMSGYENMTFGLKARKISKAEIAARVDEVIPILELQDCVDRRPSEMSGGQKQRLALARALVLRPKVLLLDEPLSNLDGPLRARMRQELSRLNRALGVTMIYVTHDQIDAMSLGERLVIMNEGGLRQIDKPITVYQQPADLFVAGFLGTPGMNFFKGSLVTTDGTVWFKEEVKDEPRLAARGVPPRIEIKVSQQNRRVVSHSTGKSILLGVRPENIGVAFGNDPGALEARVERIELLGPEMHIYCRSAAYSFVVRQMTSANNKPSEGENVRLDFDMESVYFFDPVSGARLQ